MLTKCQPLRVGSPEPYEIRDLAQPEASGRGGRYWRKVLRYVTREFVRNSSCPVAERKKGKMVHPWNLQAPGCYENVRQQAGCREGE